MKRTSQKFSLFSSLFFALLLITCNPVHSAAGNYATDVDLSVVEAMLKDGDYVSAIDELHYELDVDPDNPDILALLGFSYRKIGSFEDAMTFYEWALKSDAEHIGATEYLGELYLQTNQLDKAKEQLKKLDDLCFTSCKEYTKLKTAIEKYQQL